MAITNGYCTLAELKSVMRINDTVDDTMLEARITEASRVIDQHCDRRFYADANATARLYVPPVADLVMVDDISTTTGLVIKTDSETAPTPQHSRLRSISSSQSTHWPRAHRSR